MLTSADFRQSHQVLFQARILGPDQIDRGSLEKVFGSEVPSNPSNFTDVIDLNGDGKVGVHLDQSELKETQRQNSTVGGHGGFDTGVKLVSDEPSLGHSLASLKQLGQEQGTQVLTQDTVLDPGTINHEAHFGVSLLNYKFSGNNEFNSQEGTRSSLAALRNQLASSQPELNAKWGIDLDRGEFLLFADKSPAARPTSPPPPPLHEDPITI